MIIKHFENKEIPGPSRKILPPKNVNSENNEIVKVSNKQIVTGKESHQSNIKTTYQQPDDDENYGSAEDIDEFEVKFTDAGKSSNNAPIIVGMVTRKPVVVQGIQNGIDNINAISGGYQNHPQYHMIQIVFPLTFIAFQHYMIT